MPPDTELDPLEEILKDASCQFTLTSLDADGITKLEHEINEHRELLIARLRALSDEQRQQVMGRLNERQPRTLVYRADLETTSVDRVPNLSTDDLKRANTVIAEMSSHGEWIFRGSLTAASRSCLQVLAAHMDRGMNKNDIATMANISVGGGTFERTEKFVRRVPTYLLQKWQEQPKGPLQYQLRKITELLPLDEGMTREYESILKESRQWYRPEDRALLRLLMQRRTQSTTLRQSEAETILRMSAYTVRIAIMHVHEILTSEGRGSVHTQEDGDDELDPIHVLHLDLQPEFSPRTQGLWRTMAQRVPRKPLMVAATLLEQRTPVSTYTLSVQLNMPEDQVRAYIDDFNHRSLMFGLGCTIVGHEFDVGDTRWECEFDTNLPWRE